MLVLLAACGFGVAGVLGAITAKDWSEDVLDVRNQLSNFPFIPSELINVINALSSDVEDIRTNIAATSVSKTMLMESSTCKIILFKLYT